MKKIIAGLKWLATFLETRFPAKVNNPVSEETFNSYLRTTVSMIDGHTKEIEKMQKQIEVLNLRVGLARPIPHGLMEKRNG